MDNQLIGDENNIVFYTDEELEENSTCSKMEQVKIERKIEYEKYFDEVIYEYKYRYEILREMVNGIDDIQDKEKRLNIKKEIIEEINDEKEISLVLEGIPNVDLFHKKEIILRYINKVLTYIIKGIY